MGAEKRRCISILITLSVAVAHVARAEAWRRPYVEYERARFFVMNGDTTFFSGAAKDTLVKNLPDSVEAVIYFDNAAALDSSRAHYSSLRAAGKVRFALWPGKGWGFWSRDALPYPIIARASRASAARPLLIDARYHWHYEPDAQVARYFSMPVEKKDFAIEGGNLIADRKGNCFTVHGPSDLISDAEFGESYGCRTITRFAQRGGIGHIDERVKFLSDKIAVTDTEEYAPLLERLGFRTYLLPRGQLPSETYVNSLLVNGTLFVPTFRHPARDARAMQIYRALGFNPVAVDSFMLTNFFGFGSIHCITMTYP